ncbi:MAG: hypothetical protein NBKEAIPA_03218 [Nitrospirae bacterium]|nr:MAG: hypothetical protein UZ03_NOB001003070 [Nitrospira sp. OLB3]MBV6471286.1 hypothetical protein [Nitrospirota bacterium]MCE7966353.1 hypothetical protein [Nitrospira sp. NTP2]MCK6492010.1 hypothetical protein [Nitrospira sp.]MEB2338857.1 hypothetical protein [Nitrospirales bacterium]
MNGGRTVTTLGLLSALSVVGWLGMADWGWGLDGARPAADGGGMVSNPHSDLIFRATGAKACADCHRADKQGTVTAQVLDNALVQELRAKAKGIHGPGRFADCLRCHAGGSKYVEKYRK